jgi:hypothetical protein
MKTSYGCGGGLPDGSVSTSGIVGTVLGDDVALGGFGSSCLEAHRTSNGFAGGELVLIAEQIWSYVVVRAAVRGSLSLPRRILYIDSEGWFIAASDQYGRTARCGKRSRSSRPIRIALRSMPELRSIRSGESFRPPWLMRTSRPDSQRSPTLPVANPGIRKVGT